MFLIKNGLVIDPVQRTSVVRDICVDGDVIVDTPKEIPDNMEIIDVQGCWVVPGLFDIHCHLRDPGFTDKEDLVTGTLSAARGGFTTICPMANTRPTVDNLETLQYIQTKSKEQGAIQVLQHVAVSRGLAGMEMVDMRSLWENGAVAFSDDGLPYKDLNILQVALQYAHDMGAVVVSHAEDLELAKGGSIRHSSTSIELGIGGIPASAESAQVAREIEVLRQVPGAHLHFSHISTAESVENIRRAKADGLNVTAETTPHHLKLTHEAVSTHSTKAKMNPPLGTVEDQKALIEGLLDGTLDALATDHAPHTISEKNRPIENAPFGITGFETAVAVYLDTLYHTDIMTPIQIIECLTTKAAKCLHIKRDMSFESGCEANITIINPSQKWTFNEQDTLSKAVNSPFYGEEFTGQVIFTMYQGRPVWSADKVSSTV